jgi:hypothetical protein
MMIKIENNFSNIFILKVVLGVKDIIFGALSFHKLRCQKLFSRAVKIIIALHTSVNLPYMVFW